MPPFPLLTLRISKKIKCCLVTKIYQIFLMAFVVNDSLLKIFRYVTEYVDNLNIL